MVEQEIAVQDVDTEYQHTLSFEEKDECPLCHFALRPDVKTGFIIRSTDKTSYTAYLVCYCPKCRKMFYARYYGVSHDGYLHHPVFKNMIPVEYQPASFSPAILDLSPSFVDIYNQSLIAETQGLTEICGMGYRKALEFLIKDYLIHFKPELEAEIKGELLGKSLKRIDDHRIKVLAERSTWIGNDETHYTRKHEDLDFNDMKRFVNSMVLYVDSELAFEEALSVEPK